MSISIQKYLEKIFKEIDINAMDVPFVDNQDRKSFRTNVDLGYESNKIVPPSNKKGEKKEVLIEPPKEVDKDVEEGELSAGDIDLQTTDVPYGPYRQTGRDYNTTNLKLENSKKMTISELLQYLYEKEDNKEDETESETLETPNEPETEEETPEDISGMGGQTDQTMAGLDQSTLDSKLTANEIGKVYELKKIFNRLIAVGSYLSFSSDEELTEINEYISKSVDLFKTLSSNIVLFKDKLDDIIVIFYKFLTSIYEAIEDYYKSRDRKNKSSEEKSNA